MATTRTAAVIDALVSIFTAAVNTDQVVIKDGPFIDHVNEKDMILVGHDGAENDTGGSAANSNQEWVGIGTNNRRDETVNVTCAVLSWRGDDSNSLARGYAYGLVDTCETAILDDVTLGVGTAGQPGSVRNAMISGLELFQSNNAGGARSRVVFTVSCIARL